MLNLLIDPTAYQSLRTLDFWLGATGFLITISTFGLGWVKLAKVQRAAQAAQQAVNEVRLRVGRYDASLDGASAMHILADMDRLINDHSWREIVNAVSNVRRAMIRMDRSVEALDLSSSKELSRLSSRMNKHVDAIELAIDGQSDFPSDYLLRQTFRASGDAVERAKRIIEDSMP